MSCIWNYYSSVPFWKDSNIMSRAVLCNKVKLNCRTGHSRFVIMRKKTRFRSNFTYIYTLSNPLTPLSLPTIQVKYMFSRIWCKTVINLLIPLSTSIYVTGYWKHLDVARSRLLKTKSTTCSVTWYRCSAVIYSQMQRTGFMSASPATIQLYQVWFGAGLW